MNSLTLRVYYTQGETREVAVATAAQADYLVTGDKHFLEKPKITERLGLHVVMPARLLEVLEKSAKATSYGNKAEVSG